MYPDDGEERVALAAGLRLAAIALASAVVTATVVIGAGGAWLDRIQPAASNQAVALTEPTAQLIRTSG